MKDLQTRAEDFAKRMSNELFIMRAESDFICAEQIPDEFITKIVDDPIHIKNVKDIIHNAVILDVLLNPDDYVTDDEGNFIYSHDECYDYCYHLDNYIEAQFNNEREARLKVRYKLWVEIERIEFDPETNEETYHDMECPIAIAYRDNLQDAVNLQLLIENNFSEI